MIKCLFFIITFLTSIVSVSQSRNQSKSKEIYFFFDFGMDHFIGGERIGTVRGIVNQNSNIQAYFKKKYRNPGYRLKISGMYVTSNDIFLGIQSGITYHSNELYGSNEYNLFSVPVQLRLAFKIKNFKPGALMLDMAAGYNLFKTTGTTHKEESGPLITGSCMYVSKRKITLRFGYEHQVDKISSLIYDNPQSGIEEEIIKYSQQRQNIYLALGFLL